MTYRRPAWTASRPARTTILGAALALVSAALVGVLVHPSSAAPASAPSATATAAAPRGIFADDVPAVANLDPRLLRALRRAATDAVGAGVEFSVNSGWRSRQQQERLFRAAVARYGSQAEAARWVATPGTSAHESGSAVDLGPADATAWLSRHGAGYGLCQVYGNEPWHYELRPDAVEHGCPRVYADPTQDPRMRR